MTEKMLADPTLDAVRAESARAHAKHSAVGAGRSIFDPAMPRGEKMYALVEEVGEVARALTKDAGLGQAHLVEELIQVANVALTWAQCEDETPEEEIRA